MPANNSVCIHFSAVLHPVPRTKYKARPTKVNANRSRYKMLISPHDAVRHTMWYRAYMHWQFCISHRAEVTDVFRETVFFSIFFKYRSFNPLLLLFLFVVCICLHVFVFMLQYIYFITYYVRLPCPVYERRRLYERTVDTGLCPPLCGLFLPGSSSWAPAGMGKGGHMPPPLENCVKHYFLRHSWHCTPR